MPDTSTADKPICFVAMPIRSAGSDEHAHFAGIYEMIKGTVTAAGYTVLRADRNAAPGNINKEIITQLAEASLVIADLSDSNPNVFYELGVRHALRRSGTILLSDKLKSPSVPFDLGSYRVIQYEGSIAGISSLLQEVQSAIAALNSPDVDDFSTPSDSPVHDWYPQMPPDIIAQGRASVAPEIAEELVSLRRQLEAARERSARQESDKAPASSAGRLINQLQQAHASGEIASIYVTDAEAAVQTGDIDAFLKAASKLLRSKDDPEPRMYLRFCDWALNLGQPQLGHALLEEGINRFPGDVSLVKGLNLRLAQSKRSDDRARAKIWFAKTVGVDLDRGRFEADADIEKYASEIGHLLEILHAEEADVLGLQLVDAALERVDLPELQQDRARQLDWLGRSGEALTAYRNSLLGHASQENIRWFGNFLHNRGLHVEAAELFSLEAFIDLDDANGPLHLADEIAFHIYDYFGLKNPGLNELRQPRDLPAEIGDATIREALLAAASCGIPVRQRDVLTRVLQRADLESEDIFARERLTKHVRLVWIKEVYRLLQSDLSSGSSVAKNLLLLEPAKISGQSASLRATDSSEF